MGRTRHPDVNHAQVGYRNTIQRNAEIFALKIPKLAGFHTANIGSRVSGLYRSRYQFGSAALNQEMAI